MSVPYDKYYLTENLFGEPYPELIQFFEAFPKKGHVLDLGCGQGRDSIALARMGFSVTGLDHSEVGIQQMNQIGEAEGLNLIGEVGDIYAFSDFVRFDIILLDSMLHFSKKDKVKEIALVKKIVQQLSKKSILVVCIQDMKQKVITLLDVINHEKLLDQIEDQSFNYTFEDGSSGQKSETAYRMLIFRKGKSQLKKPSPQ